MPSLFEKEVVCCQAPFGHWATIHFKISSVIESMRDYTQNRCFNVLNM